MSRELQICPGVGNRKCSTFLSSLDRDPHPTCPRCRGKICTRDLTCDFCIGWSPAQWELFAKKCAYKDRKKSRPSGSVPPAPARDLLRKFRSLRLPPLLLPALQEGRIRGGGSEGAPGVVSREASSPPARPRSSEKGGSVSGHSSVARERASVSAAPSGAGEGEVARSQRTSPAHTTSSVASPRSSQHARRRDESREVSVDRSFSRFSRVSRSSDRGTKKDRRARSRSDSACDCGRRSRSRSSYRSRSRGKSVGGGHPLGRCPSAGGRAVSGRNLRIAPTPGACALALGETGLAGTALGVTGRGLLTATGHVDSVRVPSLAGELAVTRSPSSFS